MYDNFSFGARLLNARKDVLRAEVQRMLAGGPPRGDCYAGRLTTVLMANGEVYPCEMLDRSMGNVADFGLNFLALWRSDRAEAVRRSIHVSECACTYECAWGANVLFGWAHVPRLLAAFIKQPWGRPCRP